MVTQTTTLLQITNNGMGQGDSKLGLQLISKYLNLLIEEKQIPKFIALYNSGVKLVCNNAPTIESLKIIEAKGTKIIACKTCLNHFNIANNIEVGIAGTMIDIIDLQTISTKVITL